MPRAKKVKPEEKKPRTGGGKAVQIYKEIDHTRNLLVSGYRPNQIIAELKERWGLSTTTCESRMRAARELMVHDASQVDRHQLASQLLETYSEILRKARDSNQLNNALGAVAGIARLTGLDTKTN